MRLALREVYLTFTRAPLMNQMGITSNPLRGKYPLVLSRALNWSLLVWE